MARLEDLTKGATVKGILPDGVVTVVDAHWHGSVLELTYKDSAGRLANELLYRDREPSLEVVASGAPWSFDGDGKMLRLVSEAHRIRLAYLFDPLLAIHTSVLEPLPHQITAVYGEMLPRQPLRFLLADDPGAGKTIMAGLLIKELLVRGDLHRCLICCPGSLADQWQDEMWQRFHLHFTIISRQSFEDARSGNPYAENNLVISRLDHMSRNEDVQGKLEQSEWDLVVVDEAHKMSASFFSGEVKETKRYKLGRLLSSLTRHFLLMTATPHNGKEEDFQLFMALIDGDRFEGRFRDGVHVTDTSDLMRRLVKEQLLKFDGTPLFPERLAYTAGYKLSDAEAELYRQVTEYVREEFNRADALENEGRKGTVGFALTILQRRLASSPEAICQSLRRRRERLEKRLREEMLLQRAAGNRLQLAQPSAVESDEDLDDIEDAPSDELEQMEAQIVDEATAARTVAELQAEIEILRGLEQLALSVRRSGKDRKWEELRNLLENNPEMSDADGRRRKLVIFSEHRDTLNYLKEKLQDFLGRPEAIVIIHGGMGREERNRNKELFTQEKDVQILVATDAAGEGINLQRAHLMVNYDLPWNPNRIEQRFGRIHRIGQTEVCHLWNMLAEETREGDVFKRLFEKIEQQRKALGSGIFDILGKIFRDQPLRQLLIEAVRYGDRPDVRARLFAAVDNLADRERCRELLDERALVRDSMDASKVREIREQMERAEARRLQPHFIASFFMEAFKLLGGAMHERETGRYEVTRVPIEVRYRDRQIGVGDAVLTRYERVTFEKSLIAVPGKPLAEFVCPGHPLLEAVTDIVLERYRNLLRTGAVLLDESDGGEQLRTLFYVDHSIQDARTDAAGNRRIVSRQMQFVEIDSVGAVKNAGAAPYLDYRPVSEQERALLASSLNTDWVKSNLESQVLAFAVENLVPSHLEEVKQRKEELVDKTMAAVKDRLTKEVNYWDHRAEELKAQELAGRVNAKINSGKARQRADELQARLKKRLEELQQERRVSPLPPIVMGGTLVVPAGLLARVKGERAKTADEHTRDTERIEQLAMAAVMLRERELGFEPRDVSDQKCGYDVESRVPGAGKLRFIEVKGRVADAKTVTVTKNEILTALNKPDDFHLAIVKVDGESTEVEYLQRPFTNEPDFTVTSINFDIEKLVSNAGVPA